MKQKPIEQLELEVENFNLKYNVGDAVKVELDSGKILQTTVKAPAQIMGGHSAVGWFNDITGCYSLDRVRA